MSNLLDDNNMNDTGAGHSALAISRLKTIGSRSRITAMIQMGLFGVLILLFLYILVAGASTLSELSSMGGRGMDLSGMGSLIFAVVGLLLVTFGVYFFASFKLMNYGAKITEFTETGNPQTFESALGDRKVYFMITVIFSVITLLFNLYITFVSGGMI